MRSAKGWGIRSKMALCAMICASAFCPGCVRAILVPPGQPVRLRETIPDAKVWVADETGQEVETTVDLPAGWYCLPDPGPSPDASPAPTK